MIPDAIRANEDNLSSGRYSIVNLETTFLKYLHSGFSYIDKDNRHSCQPIFWQKPPERRRYYINVANLWGVYFHCQIFYPKSAGRLPGAVGWQL